jgi:hypothetical protein
MQKIILLDVDSFFFFLKRIAFAIIDTESPKAYILRNERQTPTLSEGSDLKTAA